MFLFCLGDLKKLIVSGFVKGYKNFWSALEDEADEEFSDEIFAPECDNVGCCEDWLGREYYKGYLNAGFFVQGSSFLGLGTFLANFANLTAAEMKGTLDGGPKWSVFNLDQKILSTDYHEICQKMSDSDKFLQDYFTDLAIALGFPKNGSLSLFDLPSMLSSTFKSDKPSNIQKTRDIFVYSQCKMDTIVKASFHTCYDDGTNYKPTWLNYLSSRKNESFHPCLDKDGYGTYESKCCNFWTAHLQNELKPIMKVCKFSLILRYKIRQGLRFHKDLFTDINMIRSFIGPHLAE